MALISLYTLALSGSFAWLALHVLRNRWVVLAFFAGWLPSWFLASMFAWSIFSPDSHSHPREIFWAYLLDDGNRIVFWRVELPAWIWQASRSSPEDFKLRHYPTEALF